jgi:hypothetical protein
MRKKIIISINILIFVALVGGFIFWKINKKESLTPINNNENPTFPINGNTTPTKPITGGQTNTTIPAGMIKIITKDGGSILMKDFYQSPYTKILDSYNDAVIKESIDYTIEFQPGIPGFFIQLLGNNLYLARENAEQGFLDKLGITKEDACRLDVTLGVHYSTNEKASGSAYGLSFCPDGKPLPKNL